MNIASNPWSFVSTDVLVATPVASPNGLILNSDGTVTITTGATTFAASNGITVINATNSAYNGFYKCITATSTTVYQCAPQFVIPAGTAGSGGGTAILNQVSQTVRIEDLSWQNVPVSATLDIRDRNGNVVWQASTAATYISGNAQNRGKVYWVQGISINVLQAGSIVIVTVN